jgi:tRNA (guanine-N7-)-methyltransferase
VDLQQPMIISNKMETGQQAGIHQYFTNPEFPLHVDLGMGSGRFIKQAAKNNKKINWIGIESNALEMMKAKKRNGKQGNLIYIWMYVEQLKHIFAKGQVERFYIQFCTPITNASQQHRQLTFHRFLSIYRELLTCDGDLIFKTDHYPLYLFTQKQMEKAEWEIVDEIMDYATSKQYDKHQTTEWEQHFVQLQTSIYYLQIRPKR